jgi:hypothetical protein
MKLTYAQQQAVEDIQRWGSLVRDSYRGWRHSGNGFLTRFSTSTVDALASKGVIRIDTLIDGRRTASLVQPNVGDVARPAADKH